MSSTLASYVIDIVYSIANCLSCCPSSPALKINGRSFKILRLLGEGGFSYVYLVQTASTASSVSPQLYALKKIRCPFGAESVRRALREVEAYALFQGNPNIIQCVDHAVMTDSSRGGLSSVGNDGGAGRDGNKTVYILLPYYQRGNLQDVINANLVNRTKVGERRVLMLMRGVCQGLKAMHKYKVPRGRNVGGPDDARKREGRQKAQAVHDEARAADNDSERQVLHSADHGERDDESSDREVEANGHANASSSGSGSRGDKRREQMRMQRLPSGADDDTDAEPLMQDSIAAAQNGAPAGSIRAYAHRDIKPGNIMLTPEGNPILMDLGSVVASPTHITSRSAAIALADDAAENSTLPYRAPELLDPKTGSVVDTKVDIWSLGCTMYAVLVGKSPFEARSEETGGSLTMCVLNGDWRWPEDGGNSASIPETPTTNPRRQSTINANAASAAADSIVTGEASNVRAISNPVKQIVAACLAVDPAERPDVDKLSKMIEDAIAKAPLDEESERWDTHSRQEDNDSDMS